MDVALFVTCLTDTYFPRVGEAVVRVLRHFGCRVHFPAAQTCCGQPAFNSGFHADAAAVARRMIDVFEPYETVVTPSASCATMVQHHFVELVDADADYRPRAQRLARNTHEFACFLRRRLAIEPSRHLTLHEPTTFHYACHARSSYSPAELAQWVAGGQNGPALARDPKPLDLCCGFGGMFAVDYPEISGPMMNDRLDSLSASGGRTVICSEAGCTLNLAGGAHRRGLPLRFKHLAECMAESLGLMEPQP